MPEVDAYTEMQAQRSEVTSRFRGIMRRTLWQDRCRSLTGKPGGLPQLVILGAQKSGTTTLHFMLDQHPDLASAERKEVHFFDENYFRGMRWYRSFFPQQDGRILFETTPSYICHPYVAERLANLLPDAKLIVLLREPSVRALSQYWMEYMRGEEDLEIREAFDAEARRLARYPEQRMRRKRGFSKAHFRNGYFWRGLYAEQLERYLRRFDRSQLLILRAEDLGTAPQETFDQICEFLSIRRIQVQETRRNTSRIGDVVAVTPSSLLEKLKKRYQRPNEQLQEICGVRW